MADGMAELAEKLKPKFFLDGVPFVYGKQKRFDLIEEVIKFEFDSSDVILCGYPRSGTTWHKTMLWLALNDVDVETADKIPVRDRVLMLERWLTVPGEKSNLVKMNEAKPPRIFFTHLPYSLIYKQIKKANAKVCFVMRNPKDVITSAFYVKDTMEAYLDGHFPDLKFEHVLMYLMSPQADGGNILKYVKEFWENKEGLDICYMFYEETKNDQAAAIRKMAKFGGKELSDEKVQAAIKSSSFKKMQTERKSAAAQSTYFYMDQSKSNFIRKGEIGDWKNHFTVAQNELFDRFMAKEIGDLNIPYQFQ